MPAGSHAILAVVLGAAAAQQALSAAIPVWFQRGPRGARASALAAATVLGAWMRRRWVLGGVFLVLVPAVQGCLWAVGYRVARKLLVAGG